MQNWRRDLRGPLSGFMLFLAAAAAAAVDVGVCKGADEDSDEQDATNRNSSYCTSWQGSGIVKLRSRVTSYWLRSCTE